MWWSRYQRPSRAGHFPFTGRCGRGRGLPPPGVLLKVATLRLVGGGGSAELLLSGRRRPGPRHEYCLTERLARAAIDAGAGFEARFVAAEAAHFQRRSDQAEQELAALAALATSDAGEGPSGLAAVRQHFPGGQRRSSNSRRHTRPDHRSFLARGADGPAPLCHGNIKRAQGDDGGGVNFDPAPRFWFAIGGAPGFDRMGRLDQAIEESTHPRVPDRSLRRRAVASVGTIRPSAVALVHPAGSARRTSSSPWRTRSHGPSGGEARAFVAVWFALLHLEQGHPERAFRRATESYTLRQIGRPSLAQRPHAVTD